MAVSPPKTDPRQSLMSALFPGQSQPQQGRTLFSVLGIQKLARQLHGKKALQSPREGMFRSMGLGASTSSFLKAK